MYNNQNSDNYSITCSLLSIVDPVSFTGYLPSRTEIVYSGLRVLSSVTEDPPLLYLPKDVSRDQSRSPKVRGVGDSKTTDIGTGCPWVVTWCGEDGLGNVSQWRRQPKLS